MRGALVTIGLLTVAVALALATPASADPSLEYGCLPPSPATAANCAGWHTAPVTIRWRWDQLTAMPSGGDCAEQTLSTDTTGTVVTCAVTDGTSTTQKSTTVKIDQTAPAVTGAFPPRPPDYNGAWDHPVAFTFTGTDATSGIASCDVVTYSGPDSPTAAVTGACRDNAGNSASRSFPFRYDTTALLLPARGAAQRKAPLLRWKPIAGAGYYNLQLYRGGRKILSTWPRTTHYQLPAHWTFGGRRYRAVAAVYRWYVWPGYGARKAHRYGKALGQSTFRIVH